MSTRRALIGSARALTLAPASARAARINDDGLHGQDWFLDSFLDLKQDIEEAAAKGKRIAISLEQRGCPYCTEMHEKHLANATISAYVRQHFEMIQLNQFGAREVTDLDGKVLPEKEMARRWAVTSTPTILFLPDTPVKGQAHLVSPARMRGLLPPPAFLAMFRFVAEKQYKTMEFPAYARQQEETLAKAIAAGKPIN
mgnify:CR=1 FL=1